MNVKNQTFLSRTSMYEIKLKVFGEKKKAFLCFHCKESQRKCQVRVLLHCHCFLKQKNTTDRIKQTCRSRSFCMANTLWLFSIVACRASSASPSPASAPAELFPVAFTRSMLQIRCLLRSWPRHSLRISSLKILRNPIRESPEPPHSTDFLARHAMRGTVYRQIELSITTTKSYQNKERS